MAFPQNNLLQDITYWAPPSNGETNDFGQPVVASGVVIKGRWENKVQQIRRLDGQEVVSSTQVYVDRDVAVSGFLKLGSFFGQPVASDATEIQSFQSTPDLRNLGQERKAYL